MAATPAPIRVLVCDDDHGVRAVVRLMLAPHPEVVIVGEAHNGREAVALANRERPHVIVMDLEMPQLNGIDATAEITRDLPDVRVVILSGRSDQDAFKAAFAAGARGYIDKVCTQEIFPAVQAVMNGCFFFSS